MHRTFLIIGSLSGVLAVALGAFGAHGLKKIVAAETVNAFQTGVQYQMYHSLALLFVAIISQRNSAPLLKWAGRCFIYGIILFSGSLYFLAAVKASGITGLEKAGIITPFGGILFIAGWLLLFLGVLNIKNYKG